MANSFVERLCGVTDEGGEPPGGKITTHGFTAVLFSVLHGAHTVAQVKTFYNMSPTDEVGFDALVAEITVDAVLVNRVVRINRFDSIMLFYEEGGYPGYETPDEVQIKLGEIGDGP